MSKSYKSEAFSAIHETMGALNEINAIDKKTMRNFDDRCLETVHEYSPEEIRQIRDKYHVSQPVFARFLNVSKNAISEWERGNKKPSGPALRLLMLIEKNGLDIFA